MGRARKTANHQKVIIAELLEALCGLLNNINSLKERNRIKWQDDEDRDITCGAIHEADTVSRNIKPFNSKEKT